MFEQRQEQRLRLLLISPAAVLLLIAAHTLLTSSSPGFGPREGFFDLIQWLSPRPEATERQVATIIIDEESEAELGPWPWPRSALARLIDNAENAGARSVILTIPVPGEDPLSPDVLASRWMAGAPGSNPDDIDRLGALPSSNLVLARALAGGPVGVGIGAEMRPTQDAQSWSRLDTGPYTWLQLTDPAKASIAIPALLGRETLNQELAETAITVAVGFPKDPGRRVRRIAPLYAGPDGPFLTAGIAALVAGGEPLTITPTRNAISTAGTPPRAIALGDGEPLGLSGRGEFRLWLPARTDTVSVPAWRVLTDPDSWTPVLEGKHVFIGEDRTQEGNVETLRGILPAATVHALTAEQLAMGAVPQRAAGSSFAEAATALVVGAAAVGAVIFLPASLAIGVTITLALLSILTPLFIFRATGMLFDPGPGFFAAVGGPMAVGATVLTNMVVRDDRVRGAFHGALPQKAMRKVQSHGGSKLLHGVHRDVTVLSCSFRLPPRLIERLADQPKDYILFQASANDRLRRTILEHDGTVDYGEDGRLLGYWNVPIEEKQHIELACACALKMLDDVSAMSQQVEDSGRLSIAGMEDLADGRIEIGISSGPCFAGPVGLGGRNRYAALGHPVGFASHLRARSPLYGPAILTDGAVFEVLRHQYAFLDLDFIRRDSEAAPETIYGLVGNPFLKASKSFRSLAEIQRELLEAWRVRDLTTATRALQKLRGMPGVPQPYVELFEARILSARSSKARREGDHAEILTP